MKKLLAVLAFVLLAGHVLAQTPETKALVNAYVNTNINTNGVGGITGSTLNTALKKIITTMCGLAVAQDCVLPAGASNSNFPGLTGEVTSPVGNPVTTITNGAVINSKIGAGAVTADKLATGAAAANLGAGSVTNTMLQHSSITIDGQACALGGTCTAPVYSVTDSRFGTSSCLGAPCPIGTGGDDSVPLNAISTACQTAGSCTVVFPPGVTVNVCSSSWNMPSTAPVSMTITGGKVQVLPGCAGPPNTVIKLGALTFGTPVTAQAVRITLMNMIVDGYCLANHDVEVDYSPNGGSSFFSYGSRFRNVVPSLSSASLDGGSNIYLGSTFNANFDTSNLVENINDPGHLCYGAYSAGSTTNIGLFPPYLIDVYGPDNEIHVGGPGAAIAGIVNRYGGENRYTYAHPWGYPATNADSQPFSEPLYNFISRGYARIDSTEFDSARTAGVRVQPVPTGAQVDTVLSVTNAGTGGTPGATTTLTGTTGTGTKWYGVGVIGPTGSLASIPWVLYGGNYSVNPSLTDEQPTATNGLTGVHLTMQMGAGGDTNGPLILGDDLYSAQNPAGISIGPGVTSLSGGNVNFTGSSGACVVLDAAATLPALWGFDQATSVGCYTIPTTAPTNSGSCAIDTQAQSYTLNRISGSFRASANCTGGTYVFSFSGVLAPQTTGWACTADNLTTSSHAIAQTGFTFNSATFAATSSIGEYIAYSCNGF